MDSEENIWYRITGATVKKNLVEAKLISSQRETELEDEVIIEFSPEDTLDSFHSAPHQ